MLDTGYSSAVFMLHVPQRPLLTSVTIRYCRCPHAARARSVASFGFRLSILAIRFQVEIVNYYAEQLYNNRRYRLLGPSPFSSQMHCTVRSPIINKPEIERVQACTR